eukprot:TRINITY_DN26429_c0_g2_i1.p1 TRINITY_DN26429_c0_g2~~TRINITY_DN26429_c0_g2_i1.p1  ORF type:complete len:206 (-),score=29.11 TRINITY_DN26429_c0_g2_i1:116-661(-)
MAIFGDSVPSLSPFGVGATVEQLARGGYAPEGKPRRLDITTPGLRGFWDMGGSDKLASTTSSSGRYSSKWRLVPSTCGCHGSSPPLQMMRAQSSPSEFSASKASSSGRLRSTAPARHWEWDDLRSERSTVREREAGRFARVLGNTVLAAVPAGTPLAVTQSAYYRRPGRVHGEAPGQRVGC